MTICDPHLHLIGYEVYRKTERCYVIKWGGKDKFIRKNAKKRFAYETEELALINYIRRTNFWINNFLEPQLRGANTGLVLAKELRAKG
jgi:hypothetical protein